MPMAPRWLTATPNAGFDFAGWAGAEPSTDNPLTLTLTSTKTVTARFRCLGTILTNASR